MTELIDMVPHFAGQASHTHCFLHIINLVAKSLLREFNTSKNKAGEGGERDKELDGLTRDIKLEDLQTQVKDPNKDTKNDDNDYGWVNEETLLNHNERLELAANIWPIRLLLIKVTTKDSPVVYTNTHYSSENSPSRIMPRDVSIHWNSMFNMLNFMLEY